MTRLEQRGELRTEVDNNRWLPFEATHIVTPLVPGFVWNARVQMAPLLHVRVRDALVTVSLEFRFNTAGEVAAIYTPARWGRFHGQYQQRPWEGHFRNFQAQGDVVVPSEGDVGWYVDGRWEPVWRGRIISLEYEKTP